MTPTTPTPATGKAVTMSAIDPAAILPPGCELPGCRHHYASGRNLAAEGCICPAWFDGGGWHLIDRNEACTAHRMAAEDRRSER